MKKTTLLLGLTLVGKLNAARHTYLWTALLALSALAFRPPVARSAVTEVWVHRYSNVVSNSNDQAFKVVRDAAGDIIVTGSTDDYITGIVMLTIKYSGAVGSMLWQQRYTNGNPQALAVDGSGNVVVTGNSYNTDYYTAKYASANGALLWEQRYTNAGYSAFAPAMAIDGSGNVVVTGNSYNGTNTDYYTAKYAAANGALLWENRYNGPANGGDIATAVTVDGSGNVAVTGFSATSGSLSSGFNTDYYTAKYAAADGSLLWEKRYNGTGNYEDIARAVAVDGSGNVVVTGYSYNVNPFSGGNTDYYTAKYAATDGMLLWEKRYNGPANSFDIAKAVAVDGSGNVMATGSSRNSSGIDDYYTAKYAATDGALLWENRYNGPGNNSNYAEAVAVDGSGNVVVTGWSVGNGGAFDSYTAKYEAADGRLLWEQRYNGTDNDNYYATGKALAIDGNGNVVVTGSSYNSVGSLGSFDYYTAKYAAADGALLWEKRYNGRSNGDDRAQAVAVDGSGNVVVTGYSSDSRGYTDYYTAKYVAASGALLWEQRYRPGQAYYGDQGNAVVFDGRGNVVVAGFFATIKYLADGTGAWTNAGAAALAVDGSGNVAVTGPSYDANSYNDYYTAKYAAADGALLWEKRYNGPANGWDEARAVAVDSSGNVVVTGSSHGTNFNNDYYTAKYAAADGALLWEKRDDGSANGWDEARALAVDGNGNVVVTGTSGGDYYTAKYAAADGALLWEQRYNGPLNNEDHARAVAVDGSGNVFVTGVSDVFFSDNCDFPRGDYYTAKYAAADGALLWEHRYNGAADDRDVARGLVVDGSGNVLVTGISNNGAPNYDFDYYTAKYAAADGALLWEKRYNAAARNTYIDERAGGSHSLALGPNGAVVVTGTSAGDYATVVYQESLPSVFIALVPTGIRIRLASLPGRSYTSERAPALIGPWTSINTQTSSGNVIEYIDTHSPAGSAFYRISQTSE